MIDLQEHRQRAARWLYSEAGQIYLSEEQSMIDRQLARLSGVHLLQMSILDEVCLFGEARVSHPFRVTDRWPNTAAEGAIGLFDQLPFEQNSLDCLVLHHVLEFSNDPHAIVREAARVVRSDGYLMIVKFNRGSLLALQQALSHRLSRKAWKMAPPSSRQLSDWLQLLEFNVVANEHCWSLPALHSRSWAEKLVRYSAPAHVLSKPFGASNLIFAKKQTVPLTPSRRRWANLTNDMPVPIMKPSAAKPRSARADQSARSLKTDKR